MKMYVNGQDILRLILGNVESGNLSVHEGEPHTYLASMNTYLEQHGLDLKNAEELHVVIGPGSATALRAILSIMNSIHFVKEIPIHGYEKSPEISDEDCIRDIRLGRMTPIDSEAWLKPTYAYAPRITPSKKDQLNRNK